MSLSTEALAERYTLSLRTVSEIANAYYFQGRIEEALRLFQSGEQWLSAPEATAQDQLSFRLRYGQFLIHRYFLTNSAEDLMQEVVQKALQEAQALKHEPALATALYLVGQTLYYHNLLAGEKDYAEARSNLQQASTVYEKICDDYNLAESLFYTGLTYDREGDAQQAKEHYLRTLKLAEQHDNRWAASEAMRHLTDHSDGEQRLRYALRSLELREEMGFTRGLPPAQLLVCEVYCDRDDLENALDYCQQAERLSEEMGLQTYFVSANLGRGEIAFKRGQLGDARTHFEKAATLARQFNNAFGLAAANEVLEKLARESKS